MAIPYAIGQYRVLEKIGSGGFGSVYLVEQNNSQYACKQLASNMANREIQERFSQEALKIEELRRNFQLEYLVKVVDILPEENAFVMEYLPESGPEYFNRTKDMEFINRLVHAIFQLHKIDVVHRDIKPENIRVRNNIPVLIDFGISSWWNSKSNILPGGTRFFSPPEIVAMFPKYQGLPACQSACRHLVDISPNNLTLRMKQVKKRHDVYSLGMTIGVLFNGKHPFTDESYKNYLRNGTSPEFEQWVDVMPEPFSEFVRLATTFNPNNRPELPELLQKVELKPCDITTISDSSIIVFNEAPYHCLACGKNATAPDHVCPHCKAPYRTLRLTPEPKQEITISTDNTAIQLADGQLFIDTKAEDFDLLLGRNKDKVGISFPDDHWMSRQHGHILKQGSNIYYKDGVEGRMPSHLSALNNIPIGTAKAQLNCGSFLMLGSTVLYIEKCFGTLTNPGGIQ
ncbi:MAG: protein kinase [Acidobacteria bacterium]|nr:protein kinase [Acidobacteriota bacterium]